MHVPGDISSLLHPAHFLVGVVTPSATEVTAAWERL